MIILAVDPGLTGACAVLDEMRLRVVFDLPTMPDPSVGPKAMIQNKVDGRALAKLLREHCNTGETVKAVVEAVRMLANRSAGGMDDTVQSQGALFGAYRSVETVLECLGWPPAYATSQTWKRFFGLIDSSLTPTQRKRKSLECARRLYPGRNELSLAKHHNRAEAVLLAHFFRETRA